MSYKRDYGSPMSFMPLELAQMMYDTHGWWDDLSCVYIEGHTNLFPDELAYLLDIPDHDLPKAIVSAAFCMEGYPSLFLDARGETLKGGGLKREFLGVVQPLLLARLELSRKAANLSP